MKNKTIEDILICPNCGAEAYEYNDDEISFSTTSTVFPAHAFIDCSCPKCGNGFRLCFEFEYNITKHWVRK